MSSSALALALAAAWVLPSSALAAPAEQPVAEPAPTPEPAAQPGQGEPAPAQPGVVPAPVYEPPPSQPVPPSNPNRGLGLVIAGSSVFAMSYLITVVIGTLAIDANDKTVGRPLLVPLGGPFVAAGRTASADIPGAAETTFALAMLGVVQLAGLGMAIGGGVVLAKSRRGARLSVAPGGLQLEF